MIRKAEIDRLNTHIENVPVHFMALTEEQRLRKPAPNKWSRQEIMGHLIDSALNNLRRFTEIQFLPQPFTVIGYQQDHLVTINHYQQLPPAHILALWQLLNRQIIYVINEISDEQLAIEIIAAGETKTLEWLIIDYIDHMEHHLKQIFGNI